MSDKQPKPRKLPSGYQDILKSIDDFFQHTYQQLQEHPLFTAPIPIRISEKEDLFVIEAELPGVDKKQISLDIYRQSIRIRVQHNEELKVTDEQQATVEKRESMQIRERVIPIPFTIQEKDVKATYRNGLLRITIPNNRKHIHID